METRPYQVQLTKCEKLLAIVSCVLIVFEPMYKNGLHNELRLHALLLFLTPFMNKGVYRNAQKAKKAQHNIGYCCISNFSVYSHLDESIDSY